MDKKTYYALGCLAIIAGLLIMSSSMYRSANILASPSDVMERTETKTGVIIGSGLLAIGAFLIFLGYNKNEILEEDLTSLRKKLNKES